MVALRQSHSQPRECIRHAALLRRGTKTAAPLLLIPGPCPEAETTEKLQAPSQHIITGHLQKTFTNKPSTMAAACVLGMRRAGGGVWARN